MASFRFPSEADSIFQSALAMEALRELHAAMAAADSQDLVEKCEDWFDDLSIRVGWRAPPSIERDFAWLLLADLVRESAVFPNLSRTIASGKLQKRIVDALKQPMTSDLLIFLNALVRFYPAACGSHQAEVTALVMSALEHSDIVVRRSAADFLALACRLGPAGERGTLHTRAWTELVEKLLNTLKLHIAESFDRELIISQDLLPIAYLKLRPLDAFAFGDVTQRAETLFMALERSLEVGVELQLAPRFPLTPYIEILQSGLVKDVGDCSMEFLVRLHRAALSSLKFVSRAVALHLAPFCRRLYQLLLDELSWAHQSGHLQLQEDVCSALTDLIDQFGISTGAHLNFDRLWKVIGENMQPTAERRKGTQLMRNSGGLESSSASSGRRKKGKKRKHGETSGQASDLFVGRRPQWSEKRSLFIASVSLLSSGLRTLGAFVKTETLTECQRCVCALALSIAAERRRNELHDDAEVQVAVLSLLRQLVEIGHAGVHPPVQIAATIFALFAQHVDTRVRVEAQMGMAVCRTLSRPLMPSLQSTIVPTIQRPAAATADDGVEEAILLNNEESDQHELDSGTVRDEDDESSIVIEDSMTVPQSVVATVSHTRASSTTKVVRIDSDDSSDEDIEELSAEQVMAPPPPKPTQRLPQTVVEPSLSSSKKPLKLANADDIQKNVDEMIKDFVVD